MHRRLQQVDHPILVPPEGEPRNRLAIAVRAGAEVFGFLW